MAGENRPGALSACRQSHGAGQPVQGMRARQAAMNPPLEHLQEASSASQPPEFGLVHLQQPSWAPLLQQPAAPKQEGSQSQAPLVGHVNSSAAPTVDTAFIRDTADAAAAAELAGVLHEHPPPPAAPAAATQKQLQDLELQIARLRTRAQLADERRDRAQSAYVALQQRVRQLCQQVASLKVDKQQQQQVTLWRDQEVARLAAELDKVQMKSRGMAEEIGQLKIVLSKQQQELQQKEEEHASLQQQLEQQAAGQAVQQGERDGLQQQVEQGAAVQAELQASNTSLKTELEQQAAVVGRLEEAASSMQQQVQELQQALGSRNEEVASLKAANSSLQQAEQQQAQRVASLQADNAAQQQALGQREEEVAQLKAGTHQLCKEKAILVGQQAIDQEALQAQKGIVANLVLAKAELKQALQDKEVELDSLAAAHARLQEAKEQQDAELQTLQKDTRALKKRLERDVQRMQRQVQQLQHEKETSLHQHQQQQIQVAALERDIRGMRAAAASHQQQHQQQQMEQLQMDIDKLLLDKNNVDAEARQLDAANWQLQKQVLDLQAQLAEKDADRKRLATEVVRLAAAHQKEKQQLQQQYHLKVQRSIAAARIRGARLDGAIEQIVATAPGRPDASGSSGGSGSGSGGGSGGSPARHTGSTERRSGASGSSSAAAASSSGEHPADSCPSSSLPDSSATPPRRVTSAASSWGQGGGAHCTPAAAAAPAAELDIGVAKSKAADCVETHQEAATAAAAAASAATAAATAAPQAPMFTLYVGDTRLMYSRLWDEASQVAAAAASSDSSSSQAQLLNEEELIAAVAEWPVALDTTQCLGVGGEGVVYLLPGYQVCDLEITPSAAGACHGVVAKITTIIGAAAIASFYQGAEAAMAMAADFTPAMPVLAAWFNKEGVDSDGNECGTGVMLMARLQCTAWDLAWPKQQQQQQQVEGPSDGSRPSGAAAAGAGGSSSSSTAGTAGHPAGRRLRCAVAAHRLGLDLAGSGWQQGDFKPDNLMVDGRGKLRLIDTTGAIRVSPEQRRGGLLPQRCPITTWASTPEQVEAGPYARDPLNDAWAAAASALMLVLGKDQYNQLLLLVSVKWSDLVADPTATISLYPLNNQEQQQDQLARVKAALYDWLEEAGQGANPALLAWVAILVGQLQPAAQQRLPAAEASRRLGALLPALEDAAAFMAGSI